MRLSSKLRKWADPANGTEGLSYWCQGCNSWHSIRTKGATAWGWNGDMLRPTFTPSVLLQGTRLTDKGNAEIEAWRELPGCRRATTRHSTARRSVVTAS